jgi:hypothetical protein
VTLTQELFKSRDIEIGGKREEQKRVTVVEEKKRKKEMVIKKRAFQDSRAGAEKRNLNSSVHDLLHGA